MSMMWHDFFETRGRHDKENSKHIIMDNTHENSSNPIHDAKDVLHQLSGEIERRQSISDSKTAQTTSSLGHEHSPMEHRVSKLEQHVANIHENLRGQKPQDEHHGLLERLHDKWENLEQKIHHAFDNRADKHHISHGFFDEIGAGIKRVGSKLEDIIIRGVDHLNDEVHDDLDQLLEKIRNRKRQREHEHQKEIDELQAHEQKLEDAKAKIPKTSISI